MEVFFATNHRFLAANLIMYKDIVVTLNDWKGYLSRMAYMFSFMVILFLLMGYIFVQMHLHYLHTMLGITWTKQTFHFFSTSSFGFWNLNAMEMHIFCLPTSFLTLRSAYTMRSRFQSSLLKFEFWIVHFFLRECLVAIFIDSQMELCRLSSWA